MRQMIYELTMDWKEKGELETYVFLFQQSIIVKRFKSCTIINVIYFLTIKRSLTRSASNQTQVSQDKKDRKNL